MQNPNTRSTGLPHFNSRIYCEEEAVKTTLMAVTNSFFSATTSRTSPCSLPVSRPFALGFGSRFSKPKLFRIAGFVRRSVADRCHFSRITRRKTALGSLNSSDVLGSSPVTSDQDSDAVPTPIVLIDQDSDSDATVVQLSFGDRLGALLDTMKALKDLGLDVTKGTVNTEASVIETKFFITKSGRKLEDPDILERVRLTIINNLLKHHPESSERLAMGETFGIKPPVKPDVDIATHIHVEDDGPKRSMLWIETADRPGLLLEIIKIISDINITVESAEIDTEGLIAKDKFHVSYRGAALNSSLSQVLINCLRYYLRRPEIDEDSY